MNEGNFLTRTLFRPKILLLLAAAVTAVAFFPLLAKLLPDLNRRAEYLLATEEIEITPPEKQPDSGDPEVGKHWSKELSDRVEPDIAKVADQWIRGASGEGDSDESGGG